MKKQVITILTIALIAFNNLSAYQEDEMDIIDDGPETSTSSNVVTPNPDIIISWNDMNQELVSIEVELRADITLIRELLDCESDPIIRMELEYQLVILQTELNNLAQVYTLEEIIRSVFEQFMNTLTNLMKTVHDTVMSIIRNIR